MDTKQFAELFGEFLQALGLHRPDQVPAGFSISLSEGFALMTLAAGAPMSQQVLAERLHLEKSTVSRLIKHLEQRGLAKSLTERHERLLAELKPDEQEALAYGLSALIRALRTV